MRKRETLSKPQLFILAGLLLIAISLFLPWAKCDWKYLYGIEHWTGLLILLLVLIESLGVILLKNKKYLLSKFFLISIIIFLLSILHFYNFAPLFNVSAPSLSFSFSSVSIGFYLTLIGTIYITIVSFLFTR